MEQGQSKNRSKERKHQSSSKRLKYLLEVDFLNMQTEFEHSESLKRNSEINQFRKNIQEKFNATK